MPSVALEWAVAEREGSGTGAFVKRDVVMQAVGRQSTVALVLLSSYLLATISVWLHSGHRHADPREGQPQLVISCGGLCGHQAVPSARADEPQGGADRRARVECEHLSDECLLCRFSVIQKSVVLFPDVTTVVHGLPGSVAVLLPAWRVAELPTTPDSRAPPHLA